jgi:DNA-binding protein YbaB
MAKTTSERQAAYRAKSDQYRISLYINGEARAALTALARMNGCSQRELLESLIVSAKNSAVSAMDDKELEAFYNVTQ